MTELNGYCQQADFVWLNNTPLLTEKEERITIISCIKRLLDLVSLSPINNRECHSVKNNVVPDSSLFGQTVWFRLYAFSPVVP